MAEMTQSHERHWSVLCALLRRPYGAHVLFPLPVPTLKRGANNHCASGATPIGTRFVSKFNTCDCPVGGDKAAEFIRPLNSRAITHPFRQKARKRMGHGCSIFSPN